MAQSLRMSFVTDVGTGVTAKKVILSVPYAEPTLTALQVTAAMQAIITADIFTFNLIAIDGAEIVETVKTDLI